MTDHLAADHRINNDVARLLMKHGVKIQYLAHGGGWMRVDACNFVSGNYRIDPDQSPTFAPGTELSPKEAARLWGAENQLDVLIVDKWWPLEEGFREGPLSFGAGYRYRLRPKIVWREIDHKTAARFWGSTDVSTMKMEFRPDVGSEWAPLVNESAVFKDDWRYRMDEKNFEKGDKGD